MFKKDFKRDNGKIRKCDSNIAKMNVFEYMYCYMFVWKLFFSDIKYTFSDLGKALLTGLVGLLFLIINIIAVIFFPITLIISAWLDIRKTKIEVAWHNRTYGE